VESGRQGQEVLEGNLLRTKDEAMAKKAGITLKDGHGERSPTNVGRLNGSEQVR